MLLIYLPAGSSRCDYIFELIFNQLGVVYKVTNDATIFGTYPGEKINYSSARLNNEFFIESAPLLFEHSILKADIRVEEKYQMKVLFPNTGSCDIGFDIFASAFFMISRYEEYLPFIPDIHGRFNAADTLAYKNNFLHIPVVDLWIGIFKNKLQEKFPGLKLLNTRFEAIVTYDVDIAFKFRGRSLMKITGAAIKDLLNFNLKNFVARIQTLNKKREDPWDVYEYLEQMIVENNLDSIFFFLLSDPSINDRNLNYKMPIVKELIDKVKTFSKIGIHPSYKSSSLPNKISEEKERLEKLSGEIINKSRQHYLKFILPATYNSLIKAGLKEDYSMGFPGLPGFRAGTCKPFYFYDLKNEKRTSLKIFPVTLMDGTFIDYKKSEPAEALKEILYLVQAVKNVDGLFISIWHNHTVSETSEFKSWRSVHDSMIHLILKNLKEK
ncbi:MAG: polysaccharide deacetylase family protein [Ginsengibacter sp.]